MGPARHHDGLVSARCPQRETKTLTRPRIVRCRAITEPRLATFCWDPTSTAFPESRHQDKPRLKFR